MKKGSLQHSTPPPSICPVPNGAVDCCDHDRVAAVSDYFWMLRSGFFEGNTREGWRAFRDGYASVDRVPPRKL